VQHGPTQLRLKRVDDRDRRLKFLFRPRRDVLEDVDVDFLNPEDEDDRRLLIASEHPRFWQAIEEGESEVEIAGEPVSAELHLAMHEIVANRILSDTPKEFWETARRLSRQGYRRHDVLHMLGTVVSDEVYDTLKTGKTHTDEEIRAALWRLPGDVAPRRSTRHPERRRPR
jgi:hypothetical protein